MKKFRIIENGVLSHAEMGNIRGGDTSKCTSYSCGFHGSTQCAIKYSFCTSDYVSCTGPKNSEKMSCQARYTGPIGNGGLTSVLTNKSTL